MQLDTLLVDKVLKLAIEIQQIPSPTFSEVERANFVFKRFVGEDLSDVLIDEIGNVYARLSGAGESLPLVVSAHTDTVFPITTNLQANEEMKKIKGPGIGDNSLGVAGLFGILWGIRQHGIILPGDLWLVANVCEEGLGDLRGMRAVVDRFGDRVLGYIIIEGMALGQVYHQGLGVKRYRITVRTPGGHSWVDYGKHSAINELANLVNKMSEIQLPEEPRSSLNVGVIAGGTSVNTIAAEAHLELDLRSIDEDHLDSLTSKVKALVMAANREGEDYVRVTTEVIGHRPAGGIPSDHPLVRLAVECIEMQGIQANTNIGSTDANIPLSRGYPSICLGLTMGEGAHTVREFIYTPPLSKGLSQLVEVVDRAYKILG
jgi:acetylornithine deacetylase/succinyl-diaminopimelate desuccinylase-like protein